MRNRYYSPILGRWLTRDPIGYQGGINLYGYVGGGPVGKADARGTNSNTCEAVVGAMHWLASRWQLTAILPGTMVAKPPVVGTAGDFEPLVIFTRPYVQLFKCCDNGRVAVFWGLPASAARQEHDTDPKDVNLGVALTLNFAFQLPYGQVGAFTALTFPLGWQHRFSLANRMYPMGPVMWAPYKPQVPPGFRLVNHIQCDCPPYRWPPPGGIPNPPPTPPLHLVRPIEPIGF